MEKERPGWPASSRLSHHSTLVNPFPAPTWNATHVQEKAVRLNKLYETFALMLPLTLSNELDNLRNFLG